MSKLRNYSICLSDIPKEAIQEHKNGKKYLNLSSWDSDEPDKYGNDFGLYISQSKQERDNKAKKVYVGNGKIYRSDQSSSGGSVKSGNSDDLPF